MSYDFTSEPIAQSSGFFYQSFKNSKSVFKTHDIAEANEYTKGKFFLNIGIKGVKESIRYNQKSVRFAKSARGYFISNEA